MNSLIEVKNLSIDFQTDDSLVHAVKNASFSIPKGKTVGLVGESGSGKTVSALSLMKLIPMPPGIFKRGEILFENKDITKLKEDEMRLLRGNKISMIFQEPMTSLNPVFKIGDQISESLILHKKMSPKQALEKSIDLLDQVGIHQADKRVHSYPHELSGGQRQRVMIAMAISCNPELLIADEPTTALDVTVQKQILQLLKDLQKKYQMSILFITHDLGVISEMAEDIIVMYRGNIVENSKNASIFTSPKHPYTEGLMRCRPRLEDNPERLYVIDDFMDQNQKRKTPEKRPLREKKPVHGENLLEVKNLKTYFPLKKNFFGKTLEYVKAVDDVSFTVKKGEILGLVGESGCGKTSLGRTILKLIPPTSGKIIFQNKDLSLLKNKQMRALRKKMQIIFQDPYASLNPRMTINSLITEPMIIHKLYKNKKEYLDKAVYLLEKVGLDASMLHRYPHEFSGGQRQRICIAKSLSVNPEFIVCDESVSALDTSVQAQILNLLLDLKKDFSLTYIFISHDLAVVKFFSDRVAVMKAGKIIETGLGDEIYQNPKDDYTKKLIDSIPKI